jgi:diguanylate cyclase (GGDEF)-like protein
VLSGLLAKIVDRIEHSHRQLADGPTVDATSVWIFAAALLLPAGCAAILTAAIYAFTLFRHRNDTAWHPHRILFNGATMTLCALTGATIYQAVERIEHLPAGAAAAAGALSALAGYRIVNEIAIAVMMYLATRPTRLREVLLSRDDLAVEVATMILGAFTAQTIIQMPWLTPAVLVLVVMMYRGLLVKKLEVAATTDGKTELLNATAWRELAQRHLWRAVREQQAAALLVIDLDRFKTLNDQHGHLAGDVALKAVADRIKHELRDYDAVGRYGGEEFVALLPNAGANAAMRVAERIRARIEDEPIATDDRVTLHLTGSVGVATYPTHGSELDALIRSADRAMYAAKDAGRNTVRLAAPSLTSHESQPASA